MAKSAFRARFEPVQSFWECGGKGVWLAPYPVLTVRYKRD